MRQRIVYLYFIIALFLLPILSAAKPPSDVQGNLIFVGLTNDLSQSVWLSVTTAGSFQLEAQGHQLIDAWDKIEQGTHLSLSPIVSQGNGGTHHLIDAINGRMLDSQNQKGGIILPPLPSEPPGIWPPIDPQPPIEIPPGGTTPPDGTTPPIETPPEVSTPGGGISPGESVTGERQSALAGTDQTAPITTGRAFAEQHCWNIWSDNRYIDFNDGRHDLNAKGATTDFSIGADKRVARDLVTGIFLSLVNFHSSAFDGNLTNRANGFSVGPYFGYLINPSLSMDGSLAYGNLQNHNKISVLNSEYRTHLIGGTLRATGLLKIGPYQIRPKPLISFTHFRNPTYRFNGMFKGQAFQVIRPQESFNFGYTELRIEGNRTFLTSKGNIVQPYVEAGVDYQFARPTDGQILTGNLTLARVSPTTESLALGVRSLISKSFLLEARGTYLSFGQHGLDVWEARLILSYSFG